MSVFTIKELREEIAYAISQGATEDTEVNICNGGSGFTDINEAVFLHDDHSPCLMIIPS